MNESQLLWITALIAGPLIVVFLLGYYLGSLPKTDSHRRSAG